jgi:hypothetical protein
MVLIKDTSEPSKRVCCLCFGRMEEKRGRWVHPVDNDIDQVFLCKGCWSILQRTMDHPPEVVDIREGGNEYDQRCYGE